MRGTSPPGRPRTDGERWVRDQLTQVRAAGFSPSAVVGFLAASHRRAADVRATRPELAQRAHLWMAAGGGAWIILAAYGKEPYRRRCAAGLCWWAAVAAMLEWHLGMFETEDGEPRNLGPADALTLGRAWLVPVMADGLSPAVIAAAAGTDVLDGIAARATASTRAGRDLEGLVDALASAAALLGARRRDEISPAAANLEIARLSAGAGYGLFVYFGRSDAPDAAVTGAARVTTPLRVGGLIMAALRRRRAGSALLGIGSVLSIAAIGRSLRRST